MTLLKEPWNRESGHMGFDILTCDSEESSSLCHLLFYFLEKPIIHSSENKGSHEENLFNKDYSAKLSVYNEILSQLLNIKVPL